MFIRHAALGAALSCALLCASALAEPFRSNQGFSIDGPDGWQIASSEQRQAVQQETRKFLSKIGNPNLESFAVMLFHPVDDQFVENINVVVTKGTVPVSSRSEKEYAQTMTKMAGSGGLAIRNMTTSQGKAGKYGAIFGRYELHMGPEVVGQWQAVVPGRNQTYVVTCSALSSEFAQYEPAFRRTIDSIQIDDEPLAMPGAMQILLGVVGGLLLLAGIVAVLVVVKTRRQAPPALPTQV